MATGYIFLTARTPEGNFGLTYLPNMAFVSYVQVLSAAFLMGLTAAAIWVKTPKQTTDGHLVELASATAMQPVALR